MTTEALENGIYAYLRYRFCVDTPYRFHKGDIDTLPVSLAKHFKTKGIKAYHCQRALENLYKKGLVTVSFDAPDLTIKTLTIRQR
jgi:hypothetical protein